MHSPHLLRSRQARPAHLIALLLLALAAPPGCGDSDPAPATSVAPGSSVDSETSGPTTIESSSTSPSEDSPVDTVSSTSSGSGVSPTPSGGETTPAGTSTSRTSPPPEPSCDPVTVDADPLVIPSDRGAIRGEAVDGLRRWLGIPYAAPPTGPLRWRPPAPALCREEVFAARTTAADCPQRDLESDTLFGDEDCLHLNLWAPEGAPPDSGWPILVFVHGGGNIQGGASLPLPGGSRVYDGARLASQGAVVAVINYRLGALGWLALDALNAESEEEISGNWGLRDQQFALRWIREHAPAIGGDPDRLLLVGESAGAVNTVMHLASPASAGLFSAAAVMSGGVGTTPLADAITAADERVAESDCASHAAEDEALLACLRDLSTDRILRQFPGTMTIASFAPRAGGSNLGPVVDGVLLPERPLDRFAAGRHNEVPVLLGTTAEEMAQILPTDTITSATAFEQQVRTSFALLGEEGVDRILETYVPTDYPSPADALIALYSDLRFVCPATRILNALHAGQQAPIYRYWFSRRAQTQQGELPASHGRELLYLFGTMDDIPLFSPQAGERRVIADMQQAWLAFADGQVPEADEAPLWEPWDPALDNAFDFRDPPEILEGVRPAECTMWAELAGLD